MEALRVIRASMFVRVRPRRVISESARTLAVRGCPVTDHRDLFVAHSVALHPVGLGAAPTGPRPPDRTDGQLIDPVLAAEVDDLRDPLRRVDHLLLHHHAEAQRIAD